MILNKLRTKLNFVFKTKNDHFLPKQRQFWYWLNNAWNKYLYLYSLGYSFTNYFIFNEKSYDLKRVEEVGPNRACTEWLLKCGAHVKFVNWGSYCNDYNKIPPGGFEAYKIEEIRAENSCIMARGFEYFSK